MAGSPPSEMLRGLSNSNFHRPLDMAHCSNDSLRELFERQHRFLNYFFANLQYDEVCHLAVCSCRFPANVVVFIAWAVLDCPMPCLQASVC